MTGNYLKKTTTTPSKQVVTLVVLGIASILLAQIWNIDFPINKNLWSSSFVLVTTGWSLLLFSIFYYVIDVLGYKNWAFIFKVIGMNSILIYLSGKLINWPHATDGFFHWVGDLIGDPYNVLAMVICTLLVKWVCLYLLYQKKIFLKV